MRSGEPEAAHYGACVLAEVATEPGKREQLGKLGAVDTLLRACRGTGDPEVVSKCLLVLLNLSASPANPDLLLVVLILCAPPFLFFYRTGAHRGPRAVHGAAVGSRGAGADRGGCA